MSDARKAAAEARRPTVAQRYARGYTLREIAAEFDVSYEAIRQDLKVIRAGWVEASKAALAERVAVESAKCDEIELEAWKGFERSQQPAKRYTVTTGPDGLKSTLVTEGRDGDPRWLDMALKACKQRQALFGLGMPTSDTGGGVGANVSVQIFLPHNPRRGPAPAIDALPPAVADAQPS